MISATLSERIRDTVLGRSLLFKKPQFKNFLFKIFQFTPIFKGIGDNAPLSLSRTSIRAFELCDCSKLTLASLST